MAIMVPTELPEDTPASERVVFEHLRSSWRAHPWRVYHSVYIRNPMRRETPRETDLVVCIPEIEAIICIEAKGGRYRTLDGGSRWESIGGGDILQPPPPEKARSAMFLLKNELVGAGAAKEDNESHLSFGCAVALPDGNFPQGAILPPQALILEQIDISDTSRLTSKLLEHVTALRRSRPANPEEVLEARLEFNEVINYLEREEEMQPATVTAGYLNTVRELLRLTPEQQACQVLTAGNDRCIIDGAAGTGKTVLAKELARKLCEEEGKTVGLLCSNSAFVAHDLQNWVETISDSNEGCIVVGTPATLPLNVLDQNEAARMRFQERLAASPDVVGTLKLGDIHAGWRAFIDDTLGDLPQDGIFDYLVIDEAQNLCAEPFLDLFDGLLKGGMVNGCWTMFGDFANQNIVSPDINEGRDGKVVLKARFADVNWANFRLSANCRNTQDIALETHKLVDIEVPTLHAGVRGPVVEFDYFGSQSELGEILHKHVSGWSAKGVAPSQIVLLTGEAGGEFDTSRTYGGCGLVGIHEARAGQDAPRIRYSDIYDFQGLESDVVILVLPVTEEQAVNGSVVTLPSENHMRRMFYIGMSRARIVLVIVAEENYRESLEMRRELFDEMRAF